MGKRGVRWFLLAVAISVNVACIHRSMPARAPGDDWRPLFNGRDLDDWDVVPGSPAGDASAPFSVVMAEGAPALRASEDSVASLASREELDDFHLRVEYKWGTAPAGHLPASRASGIVYRAVNATGASEKPGIASPALECRIGDPVTGDLWASPGTIMDVKGQSVGAQIAWHERGGRHTLTGAGDPGPARRAIARRQESPSDAWNLVEVACFRDTCVHAVNGRVVMVLHGTRYPDGTREVPLRRGKIALQAKGAEILFRKVEVRGLTAFPPSLAP